MPLSFEVFISELWSFIFKYWELSLGYVLSPSKRVYVLYLITSLLMGYYIFRKMKISKPFFAYVFNKRVWLSRSAMIDYSLFMLNGLVKLFLIVPYTYLGFLLSFYVNESLIAQFDYYASPISYETALILYSFILALALDFGTYLLHLAMHKIPCLWDYHKVHHSARSMNPFTQYRIHPIELLLNNALGILIFGLVTGIMSYYAQGVLAKWTLLGVNVFSFFFFIFGANLRHSHIPFRYPKPLEYLFISPMQHQIHHSREQAHWNKNMGSRLALWDWLFGTLYLSDGVKRLSFGIGGDDDKNYASLGENLFRPMKHSLQRILSFFPFRRGV